MEVCKYTKTNYLSVLDLKILSKIIWNTLYEVQQALRQGYNRLLFFKNKAKITQK